MLHYTTKTACLAIDIFVIIVHCLGTVGFGGAVCGFGRAGGGLVGWRLSVVVRVLAMVINKMYCPSQNILT